VLGIGRTPPGARALQSLLGDIAVGAFNFSGSNRQVALQCALVVELLAPLVGELPPDSGASYGALLIV